MSTATPFIARDAATFRVDTTVGPVMVRFTGDGQAYAYTIDARTPDYAYTYSNGDHGDPGVPGEPLTVHRVAYRAYGWFHRAGTCHYSEYNRDQPCTEHARRNDTGAIDSSAPLPADWQYGQLKSGADRPSQTGEADSYSRFPDIKRVTGTWSDGTVTDKARRLIHDVLLAAVQQAAREHPEGILAGDVALAETRYAAAARAATAAVQAMQDAMALQQATEMALQTARLAWEGAK